MPPDTPAKPAPPKKPEQKPANPPPEPPAKPPVKKARLTLRRPIEDLDDYIEHDFDDDVDFD